MGNQAGRARNGRGLPFLAVKGWPKLILPTARVMVVTALIVASAFTAPRVRAQAPAGQSQEGATDGPAFDVASIRPNSGEGPSGSRFDPTGVTIRSTRLLDLISMAYQMPYSRVTATNPLARDLLGTRYDIVAKADHEVPKDQLLVMLQTLLAERFKLMLHHESKVQPVYKLIVAKNGPRIKESKSPYTPDQTCNFPQCTVFNNTEMWVFAATLTGRMGRPVLDLTGLKGAYDFTLRLDTLEELSSDDPALKSKVSDWSSSSIFTDIQKQLGLELKADKAPVDSIVVDHAERPSAN